jgi:hypothetical protein
MLVVIALSYAAGEMFSMNFSGKLCSKRAEMKQKDLSRQVSHTRDIYYSALSFLWQLAEIVMPE